MELSHSEIEAKWKNIWEANQAYKVEEDTNKPKCYVLTMFPYPSGAGLHVGHPLGYIGADIYSRFKRQKGFNVLHPMGFDAFGLPAEQYAIETGQHPAVTTAENLATYKRQLNAIGFSYDWSREFRTSDPEYYKWTQWIFMQLFDGWYDLKADMARPINDLIAHFESSGTKGLRASGSEDLSFSADDWNGWDEKRKGEVLMNYRIAYQSYSEVNWCAALGTVLANDEVKDGVSERGGHPVSKMKMRQWFLRITAFAPRLLNGLDKIDWPESLKEQQRNWIGRSEGAEIDFAIEGFQDESIKVFTTRPDTLFGVTFMVLAPEHELVKKIAKGEQKAIVSDYLKYVESRSDIDRQAEKEVTGAFTGAYCVHPFSGKRIPIYIAEYVLAGYGTGAIMAVPHGDERDHAFASKFRLPIVEVVDQSEYPNAGREDKLGKMVNSDFLDGMEVKDAIPEAINRLVKKGVGKRKVNYKIRDAGFSRQRYWGEPFPIVYRNDQPCLLDENQLPVELPDVSSFKPSGDGRSPLAGNKEWLELPDGSIRETDTMPGYAGSSWYFLRFMDPHNDHAFVAKEKEAYWKNVDLYVGGSEHAVGHLMYSRMWQMALFDLGLVSKEEPFKKLINQGMIQGRSNFVYRIKDSNTFVSRGLKGDYNTSRLNVDISLVKDDLLDIEAFKSWRSEFKDAEFILEEGVYHCGYEVEKMSKSKYNVINPDDIVAQYGADCFRMYEMFLGPIEQSKPWDTQGIDGVAKFLQKLWRLFYNQEGEWQVIEESPTDDMHRILHQTIKKVDDDVERFAFNTCVSQFMICVNELTKLRCHHHSILRDLVAILSPFAPFIASELWEKLGEKGMVLDAKFPEFEEKYLKSDTVEYPVSVNGKMRSKLRLPAETQPDEAREAALADAVVQKWVDGKEIRKFIFVPGRIINIVV